MPTKRALICGISGQDGSYLAQLLLKQGYEVYGTSRDAEVQKFDNLHRLKIFDQVRLSSLDPKDPSAILAALRRIKPDEIFSLAGQTSVGLSFEQPVETIESIAVATLNLLEAVRLSNLDIRLYNAGSSEIFGDTGHHRANEDSPFRPRSPYAVAKGSAFWTVANYREAYNMYACTGILSNHESPLRPYRFVTRKIIHAVALTSLGQGTTLKLGNLDIERDWGWAPEYVEAIALMLHQPTPRDLIIATGQSSRLTDFVATAYGLINEDWRNHVVHDNTLKRPTDIACSRLDPARAFTELGWRARHTVKEVTAQMLDAELVHLGAPALSSSLTT